MREKKIKVSTMTVPHRKQLSGGRVSGKYSVIGIAGRKARRLVLSLDVQKSELATASVRPACNS